MNAPLVSVKMITYNHEKYIAEAIEGVLMQKTNFPVELVIGEDCSTDRTREIIHKYILENPHKIRLITSENNVGAKVNAVRTSNACKGKYVAICEGDDYWTDPYKLQKQVDFLENNPEFVMCCHAVEIIYEGELLKNNNPFTDNVIQVAEFKDLVDNHFIPTNSLIYRNGLIHYPDWYYKIISGDRATVMMLASFGKCYYMFEKMAVKRKHPGGITQDRTTKFVAWRKEKIILYEGVNKETNYKYDKLIKPIIARRSLQLSKTYLKQYNIFLAMYYLFKSVFINPKFLISKLKLLK